MHEHETRRNVKSRETGIAGDKCLIYDIRYADLIIHSGPS